VQLPLQFPAQFPQLAPQLMLPLSFDWHELLSPENGQEMPALFRSRAIPARSRTSATIGYLFIIDRSGFFYLYFIAGKRKLGKNRQ